GQKLYNYWGYSTVNFFSPKAGYAASGSLGMEVDELKYTIKTLHENGIEVILDVVFNHTAEGDEKGPVISYKGIDNRTYYLLTPDGHYYNFSGCGNTMNCNNAVVRSFIKDCLRYWVASYHIDGFRFDLASILTRNQEGAPMISPPILESLAYDAVLGRAKLIAEAWDAGGLYQVGSFPSWNRFSEWNGKYRDCVRRFIKGDGDSAPELYNRIAGSEDLYAGRTPAVSINFITCHDGFTLVDLVSYNEKHNEPNGESNLDGANDNNSWNCGAEGETNDEDILSLRRRQMENLLTLLFLSRGVPMLLSGDEMGNTQKGNNNVYCQDNEISWIDWTGLKKNGDFHSFVKNIISFRKAHPVLRSEDFFRGHNGTGFPELSFHSETPWQLDMKAPTHTFAFMYAEDHKKFGVKEDSYIYVMVNAHWEPHTFTLPIIPEGFTWHLVTESAGRSYPAGKEKDMGLPSEWSLGCRMTVVMIAKKRQ
ncbi:MAG: glycogen debranching enzyme, partial [Oribacterium sp.]|nr:glycogen debranching enzyme [Oribacterium sp.]